MSKLFLFLCLFLAVASPGWAKPMSFPDRQGCFLMMRVSDGKIVRESNPGRCQERFPPCSTFKIAAAAMGYDAGRIPAGRIFKWDGTRDIREVANADQSASSWMKNSVVWVTQQLMREIGREKVQDYLDRFSYGNEDFSGGLEKAWLVSSLQISALEQAKFLRRLWRDELNISSKAQRQTRELIQLRSHLHGKTGTGFIAPGRQIGWFVGHLRSAGVDYVFACNQSDVRPHQTRDYLGPETRKKVESYFENEGLLRRQ